jgi:hypothetical protein
LVFTIPQIWVHVYLGTIGRAALENKGSALDVAVNAVTVVVVLCAVALITRRMRAALRAAGSRASVDALQHGKV